MAVNVRGQQRGPSKDLTNSRAHQHDTCRGPSTRLSARPCHISRKQAGRDRFMQQGCAAYLAVNNPFRPSPTRQRSTSTPHDETRNKEPPSTRCRSHPKASSARAAIATAGGRQWTNSLRTERFRCRGSSAHPLDTRAPVSARQRQWGRALLTRARELVKRQSLLRRRGRPSATVVPSGNALESPLIQKQEPLFEGGLSQRAER